MNIAQNTLVENEEARISARFRFRYFLVAKIGTSRACLLTQGGISSFSDGSFPNRLSCTDLVSLRRAEDDSTTRTGLARDRRPVANVQRGATSAQKGAAFCSPAI